MSEGARTLNLGEGHRLASKLAQTLRGAGYRADTLPAPSAGEDGYWCLLVAERAETVDMPKLLGKVDHVLDEMVAETEYRWFLDFTTSTGVARPFIAVYRETE